MFLNAPRDQLDIPYSKLNGKELDKATEYKHIVVLRYADTNKRLIEDRITAHCLCLDGSRLTARLTAYALVGAGFHRHNGLNPKPSVYIYNTYVLPRLLYRLETIILLQKDIEKLDKFHKDILRRIQHLPERTALSAVYGLAGQFPIEHEIHKRQLK